MTLSNNATERLLDAIRTAGEDSLDCESCFEMMAEFVENELRDRPMSVVLKKVAVHLEQCECCRDEHAALLEAIRAAEPH